MSSFFFRKALIVFILAAALPAFCETASAQYEEDLKILQMYYQEDELVISSSRFPKPISQVAENMTVITAKEIEAMNAHTVAEVLNRVPGLFVSSNQDFGATSFILIQGSDEWHVLIMLDGVPWNFIATGFAETNSIPVGIIQRIEVIKGPASSVWGSSLGGVINIITKPTGTTLVPQGSLQASAGEKRTQDYRAQAAGKLGPAEYYVFAERKDSDGLRFSRHFEDYSLFSKVHIPFSSKVGIGFSIGHTKTDMRLGDFPDSDISTTWTNNTSYAKAFVDATPISGPEWV